MNEQEKFSSELPIRAVSETLADPTCEEGVMQNSRRRPAQMLN